MNTGPNGSGQYTFDCRTGVDLRGYHEPASTQALPGKINSCRGQCGYTMGDGAHQLPVNRTTFTDPDNAG